MASSSSSSASSSRVAQQQQLQRASSAPVGSAEASTSSSAKSNVKLSVTNKALTTSAKRYFISFGNKNSLSYLKFRCIVMFVAEVAVLQKTGENIFLFVHSLRSQSYWSTLVIQTVACYDWDHLRQTYFQHSLHRQTWLLVGSRAAPPPLGTVFLHLYAPLTVSLVLGLSSRLTRKTCVAGPVSALLIPLNRF